MRIVHFTDVFLSHANGVATSVVNMARELGRQGHSVLIIAPQAHKGRTKSSSVGKNVRVIALRSYPAMVYPKMRVAMPSLTRVTRELKAFKPDVAHIHTPLGVGFCGLMACKALRIPVVGTNHVYLTKDNADFFRFLSPHPFLQKMFCSVTLQYFRMFYGQCDMTVAPSTGLVEAMKELRLRTPVRHLPNALSASPTSLSRKEHDALKKKWNLGKRVILHCGRISGEKSVGIVVQAFATIVRTHPDASLLIIGDGPARKDMEKLATALGIRDRVVFMGMIEHDALIASRVLFLGDLFATASTMENQPMAVLEAMSFGLPIIAVRAAAMPELVSGNGLIVEPENAPAMAKAMTRLLDDEALRSRLSKRSLAIVEEYDGTNVAARALKLYAETLDARNDKKKSKKKQR